MRLRRTIAWALAFIGPSAGFAAEGVRLADLVAEALANNREVLAARKQYEAALQRPAREAGLPDPTLSVGYAGNGGPLPGQGLGSNPTSNIGVTVSQEIPYPGKRKLRTDIARKEAEAERERYLAMQLSVQSRVTQAFHRLHHIYSSLEVLAQGKDVLGNVIHASEARYAAGKAPQVDVFQAQTQLSLLEVRIVKMQQDRQTTEAEMNSLLNRKPGSPLGELVRDDPAPLRITVDELLAKAAGAAPELRRDERTIQRGELAVNLARKEFHPDYTVGAGYFNQGGMAPMFQVRVDVPLRLHAETRQRPALAEQVDLLAAARRDFEAAGQNLQFRVREAYAAAEAAWRLMALYSDTILPQTQLTIDASRAAYETGGVDLASVLKNVWAKVDLEEQLHEQEMDYAVACARLDELTGLSLTGVSLK